MSKEAKLSQLTAKSRESDVDSRSEYSAARAPSNVSLRLEIQKKDDVKKKIFRLKMKNIRRVFVFV